MRLYVLCESILKANAFSHPYRQVSRNITSSLIVLYMYLYWTHKVAPCMNIEVALKAHFSLLSLSLSLLSEFIYQFQPPCYWVSFVPKLPKTAPYTNGVTPCNRWSTPPCECVANTLLCSIFYRLIALFPCSTPSFYGTVFLHCWGVEPGNMRHP